MDGEKAAVPVCQLGWREDGCDLFGAVAGEQPFLYEGVDVIELRDFDEDGEYGGWTAGDEFEAANGAKEVGAAALSILPAFALLEAKGGKKAGETVKISA